MIWLAVCLLACLATAQVPSLPKDQLAVDLFSQQLPLGLPTPPHGQVLSQEMRNRFTLGRRLFFDPILSADRKVACASCHDPRHGFSSPQPLPIGVHGRKALRNAPTLLNRAFGKNQSWDGSSPTLVHQVTRPIENANEMDLPLDRALKRLRKSEDYRRAFRDAYAEDVTKSQLADALSTFVGRLYLGDSPVDRFWAGDRTAMTVAERGGMWIWESKGRCWKCHSGPNFSDEGFHNTGVGVRDGVPEPARLAVTGLGRDRGRFKTPTLRGLSQTAPYMHDGSLSTLVEVVEFYRRGGGKNDSLDRRIAPLELSDQDAANLVAFLKALSKH